MQSEGKEMRFVRLDAEAGVSAKCSPDGAYTRNYKQVSAHNAALMVPAVGVQTGICTQHSPDGAYSKSYKQASTTHPVFRRTMWWFLELRCRSPVSWRQTF